MQPADLRSTAPGRLVKTVEDRLAYVPDPLPREVQLDNATIMHLSAAQGTLGELQGIGRTVLNPSLLINPFVRREALLSSRIEGTTASLQDVVLFEAKPVDRSPRADAQEVLNYVHALHYGYERLSTLPISKRLICELHGRLLEGNVRGKDSRPGEFRDIQNYITQDGVQARFVPPPPVQMMECLNDFEFYLGNPPAMPLLIQLPLIHYQFETIHPFNDGNGRIGRLLISLLLCERGALTLPLLYLSAYLERHRDQYMDHLRNVSVTGNWLPWIQFFLKGVEEQARDGIQRSQRLFDLANEYRERLHKIRSTGLGLKIVDSLFNSPAITLPRAQVLLGTTYQGAQYTIKKLVPIGILIEVERGTRPKIFVAPEIITVLDADPSQ